MINSCEYSSINMYWQERTTSACLEWYNTNPKIVEVNTLLQHAWHACIVFEYLVLDELAHKIIEEMG